MLFEKSKNTGFSAFVYINSSILILVGINIILYLFELIVMICGVKSQIGTSSYFMDVKMNILVNRSEYSQCNDSEFVASRMIENNSLVEVSALYVKEYSELLFYGLQLINILFLASLLSALLYSILAFSNLGQIKGLERNLYRWLRKSALFFLITSLFATFNFKFAGVLNNECKLKIEGFSFGLFNWLSIFMLFISLIYREIAKILKKES